MSAGKIAGHDIVKIHFTCGLTAIKPKWAPLRKSEFLTTQVRIGDQCLFGDSVTEVK